MKALACLFVGHRWIVEWTSRRQRDGSWLIFCDRCAKVKCDSVTHRGAAVELAYDGKPRRRPFTTAPAPSSTETPR